MNSPAINVLSDVEAERVRQDNKWGIQNHPDGTGRAYDRARALIEQESCEFAAKAGNLTWRDILNEEVWEAYAETVPELLRAELIQVASVCVAWVECIDRRKNEPVAIIDSDPGTSGFVR